MQWAPANKPNAGDSKDWHEATYRALRQVIKAKAFT